ncbi:hypothetical protein [Micromonospora coerulea]|uniref:hypothetical protein n=1 Tax=Micromonospora coerulea TaxID=47856 RepID=UPI00190637ED|nr:hypothetical protein [Micromonospora veneta]
MQSVKDKRTMTEVSEMRYEQGSIAPDGGFGIDYYTVVVSRQDWHAGQYAGRSYKIVDTYMHNAPGKPGGYRGQRVNSTSSPWKD